MSSSEDADGWRWPAARHHGRPNPAPAVDTPLPSAATRSEEVPLPRPPRPWYQLVWGQWPLFVTLCGVFAGMVVLGAGFWRRGSTIVGLAVLMGAGLRLLPGDIPGLLRVRSRWVDFATLVVLGAAIIVMAWIVSPTRK